MNPLIPGSGARQGLLVLALGALSPCAVAQFLVDPVVIEMQSRQRVAMVSVTVSPKLKAPVTLQTEVLAWKQDLGGKQVLEETGELLVSPAIASVKPGQRQVFRIGLRGQRSSPDEGAYRLIIEDVSEPESGSLGKEGLGVTLRIRNDLPVMIAPVGKVTTAVRWNPCPAGAAAPAGATRVPDTCVRLLNAGNRRIRVQTLTLTGDGWQQPLVPKDGGVVLAGTEREWRVPLAKNQTGAVRSVQVQTARGETLQAEAGGF